MTRNSALNPIHMALGSTLDGDTWNGMPIPWSYDSDVNDEVIAVRSRAGLYDVSALNIVNISGKDAESVLDKLVAKDITRLKVGMSVLAAEVDENGAICDDIMVIRDGVSAFRISHGSGHSLLNLSKLAKDKDVVIEPDFDAHILSLQGPKSLEILAPHVGFELSQLPYFQNQTAILFGRDVVIARGGYSGERGYEVYCTAADAVYLWEKILEAGQPYGAIPASWNSLDITRVEAALLFFPFEMPEGNTSPWEVNMAWGIDEDKAGDYIGKVAVLAAKGKERYKQAGMVCKAFTAMQPGSKIFQGDEEVGVVTSSTFSRYLMQSLAMVHLKPEFLAIGTQLLIRSEGAEYAGYVSKTPFYDPLRLRTHPSDAA